jgi:TonB-dependent starch-binding outer membrane protein SusC
MKQKLLFLCLFFCLGLFSTVLAQERTITGKVTDAKTGEGLPGVTVFVKGTNVGSTTNTDGNYTLNVPSTGIIVFQAVGMLSQEFPIGAEATINVALVQDIRELSEVVVTGYGTQEKREVSAAIGSVKGDVIQNLPIPSIDRAIQGRIAGVQINANNGIPGGASQVRIRGVGSISGGNEPLYIIDGVQMTAGDRTRRVASSNILNGLNNNDIESIEVLKDAAAASIYGAQAANGVILITTKRGKQGKPQVNVNYYTGFTDVIRKIPLLTGPEWVNLRTEALSNFYGPFGVFGLNPRQLAQQEIQQTYGVAGAAPTYDWQHLVTRIGSIQNLDISVAGGNEKNKFLVSGSYNNQKAQFNATDFRRLSLRLNMDNQISKKVSLQTTLNFAANRQDSPFGNAFNTNNQVVTALGIIPLNSPYNEDGSLNTSFIYPGTLGANSNPILQSDVNILTGITSQVIGNFAVNYDIIEGLRFRSSYSIEFTDATEDAYFDARTPGGAGVNGSISSFLTRVVNIQTDQTLNYEKKIGEKHRFSAILGFNYRDQKTTGFTATGIGVVAPAFNLTLNGTTPNATTSVFGTFKLAGVFARVNYVFDEKYIVSATIRRDGSSRFGGGNLFGWFPGVSVAWRLSDEDFMKNLNFISDFKIRGSYGSTGNQDIGDFSARSLFSAAVAFGSNSLPGIGFNQLGNANLGWERNIDLGVGVDYGFFKGRISGSVDYFWRTRRDLLFVEPLPLTSGFGGVFKNIGSTLNRGLEILLTTRNFVGAFEWSTDFNFTLLRNEVKSLLREGEDLPNNGLWVGKPLGQVFVARYAGVNPADGRAMWYDRNNDITYNPVADDRTFINRGTGSTLVPRTFGGITNTISFKGFEIVAFLQFQTGNLAFSNQAANLLNDFRFEVNQERRIFDRWTTPGQITDYPRLFLGANEPGSVNSLFGGAISSHDRFVEDASYIRLKQLTFAYNLPAKVLSKIKFSTARVYVQGVNLWTRTNFTGFDPEFAAGASDIGVIPQGKNFIIGAQIGF